MAPRTKTHPKRANTHTARLNRDPSTVHRPGLWLHGQRPIPKCCRQRPLQHDQKKLQYSAHARACLMDKGIATRQRPDLTWAKFCVVIGQSRLHKVLHSTADISRRNRASQNEDVYVKSGSCGDGKETTRAVVCEHSLEGLVREIH